MNSMPRTAPSHTLKQALLKALTKAAIGCAAIAALLVGASLLPPSITYAPHALGQIEDMGGAHAKGSPAAVWAKHKDSCWQGTDSAKADIPGAAIVQMRDGLTVYTQRPALVSSASDEVMASMGYGNHDDARIVVIALCI